MTMNEFVKHRVDPLLTKKEWWAYKRLGSLPDHGIEIWGKDGSKLIHRLLDSTHGLDGGTTAAIPDEEVDRIMREIYEMNGLPAETLIDHTREQMLERLEGKTLGVVVPVGSESGGVREAFEYIKREATRSGWVSWTQMQHESMEFQPLIHPEVGIERVEEKVVIDHERFEESIPGLGIDGLDFDENWSKGLQFLYSHFLDLKRRDVVKTHITAPSICEGALKNPEDSQYFPFIYEALLRGHTERLREIAPTVVISVDLPGDIDASLLAKNMEIMLGDEYDENGKPTKVGSEVVRMYHNCKDGDWLNVMARRMPIDIIHYDVWQFGVAPLLGRPEVLADFLSRGWLAWGGIPQVEQELLKIAKELGFKGNIEPKGPAECLPAIEFLMLEKAKVADYLFEAKNPRSYRGWILRLSKETSMSEKEVAERTLISPTCGLGTTKLAESRNLIHALAQDIGNRALAFYS